MKETLTIEREWHKNVKLRYESYWVDYKLHNTEEADDYVNYWRYLY